MEFQQKGQQITLSQGRYFYEDRWEANKWEKKNTAVELTFMVKAFTQNGGNYWVLMNFLCRKMLFSFSYTDHDQNSIYGDMPYREATHWLWAIDLG
jgi:outer membrane receptor for ferrienterochelin and colicins